MNVDLAYRLGLLYESKDITLSKRLKATILGDLEKRHREICEARLALDREEITIEETIARINTKR